jgi:hypothetical protein
VEDLVQTLITGFLVSALFIVIVWWFWRRYDQPSEAQLEREEELAKKREEQAMWRAVEAQMAEEKAQMEEHALYLRKKAEQTQRAQPPAVGALTNALEAFGTSATITTEASHPSFEGSVEAPKEGTQLDEADLEVEDDRDVLLASAPIDVRQDPASCLHRLVKSVSQIGRWWKSSINSPRLRMLKRRHTQNCPRRLILVLWRLQASQRHQIWIP